MSYQEHPVMFDCENDSLIGIIAVPERKRLDTGVLIITGGPQYRVGSHRQFVLLARTLAEQGIASMRFDYRGMGDSDGDLRSFETVDADIGAAIDCFVEGCPQIRRIVLWGLCDAATAACFYAPLDRRVSGLVLLNPWVRTEAGIAETNLKTYYGRRLFQRSFWSKLLSGHLSVGYAARGLFRSVGLVVHRSAAGQDVEHSSRDLPSRMAIELARAEMRLLLILSGRDYVANEFDNAARRDPRWTSLIESSEIHRLKQADHTFSRRDWSDAVARATSDWVAGLSGNHCTSILGNTARDAEV